MRADEGISVVDIGCSLALTRSRFEHGAVLVATTREEFLTGLEALASDPAGASGRAIVLSEELPEDSEVLALAEAHAAGESVDWKTFFADTGARPVDLPTYAFQRERFWLASSLNGGSRTDLSSAGLLLEDHPLAVGSVAVAGEDVSLFTGRLSLESYPWLADHAVFGTVLLPGTAFVELALHAGERVGCPVLEDLTLETPLVLPERGGVSLQVVVGADRGRRTPSGHRALRSRGRRQ
ncbi:hypothetical protein [Streptomyces sp. MJP52]|uniref:polyketide synthase dehydratase domain-containing protein n=1 Tax=Streptomyces sp. MJP52 TaxID=2940555 RepID=UPI0032AED9A5